MADPTVLASFDGSVRFAALRAPDEVVLIILNTKEEPHPERAAQRADEGRWSRWTAYRAIQRAFQETVSIRQTW
ncbi:hypothetical protein [Stella sp.]|uniref:hypothetical protein n=1 Tax=Stella sp. TaxID=2912054 RepID=UPI0035B224D0